MRRLLLAAAAPIAAVALTAAFPTAAATAQFSAFAPPPVMHGPIGPTLGGIGTPPFSRDIGWEERRGDHHGGHGARFHRRTVGGIWLGHSGWSGREVRTEDWWHDNTERSYPRWMSSGGCKRVWWSGGGWRC